MLNDEFLCLYRGAVGGMKDLSQSHAHRQASAVFPHSFGGVTILSLQMLLKWVVSRTTIEDKGEQSEIQQFIYPSPQFLKWCES